MKNEIIQMSRAWYGSACLPGREYFDEIHVSNEHGEFSIEFIRLIDRPSARVCAFEDGAKALASCPEVLTVLETFDGPLDASPASVLRELLTYENYEDVTTENAEISEKEQWLRNDVRRQLNELQNSTDWAEVPGDLMSIGLFRMPGGELVVAGINVGAPDPKHDLFRAQLLGTSSLSSGDEEQDHTDTITGLLDRLKDILNMTFNDS